MILVRVLGMGGLILIFCLKVRSKCAIAMVFLVNIGFIESIKNLKKSKMKECGAAF